MATMRCRGIAASALEGNLAQQIHLAFPANPVRQHFRTPEHAALVSPNAHCRSCSRPSVVCTAAVAPATITPRIGQAQPVTSWEDRAPSTTFFYDGVIFDMDGTLTEAHIDFADMRTRTAIPMGDLFTVMEAWADPMQTAAAMKAILDIEAEAATRVSTKEGLIPLLQLLRDRKVPVALVTRNTRASVAAFFDLIGPEWASIFSPVLTREFKYVKPDKRLLLHVAQTWNADPSRLLMVGDSLEDVEVGNAAGTATCLVAGGGNERPGAPVAAAPAGAVATFTVSGLDQLTQQLLYTADNPPTGVPPEDAVAMERWALEQVVVLASSEHLAQDAPLRRSGSVYANRSTDADVTAADEPCLLENSREQEGRAETPAGMLAVLNGYTLSQATAGAALGWTAPPMPMAGRVRLGWPALVAAGEQVLQEGAPPPGLAFLDWLVGNGALRPGACSFPRMGAAAGGLATCPPAQYGDRVLHLCCGEGGLTKMLASQGMRVVGVDVDVSAAQRRGLTAVTFSSPRPLTGHSLTSARAAAQQPFDVVLMCSDGGSHVCGPGNRHPVLDQWWFGEALNELQAAMHRDGRLCAEVTLSGGVSARAGANPAAIINSINSSGMTVVAWQMLRAPHAVSKGAACGGEATQLRLVAKRH